jgi:hypothetical protein
MSDLNEVVQGYQDVFQKLLSYVPGFKGYIQRSQRRAADKLLRDQVALRYSELASRAGRLQKTLVDSGEFDLLDEVEGIALRLRTFVDRIRNASYGYTGFFDAVKINEAELAKLYAFDAAFFELADQIEHGLDNLESAIGGEGLPAAIRAVSDLARQVGETYDRRYQVITGAAEQ